MTNNKKINYFEIIVDKTNKQLEYWTGITVDASNPKFLKDYKDISNIIFDVEMVHGSKNINKCIDNICHQLTRKTIKSLIEELYMYKEKSERYTPIDVLMTADTSSGYNNNIQQDNTIPEYYGSLKYNNQETMTNSNQRIYGMNNDNISITSQNHQFYDETSDRNNYNNTNANTNASYTYNKPQVIHNSNEYKPLYKSNINPNLKAKDVIEEKYNKYSEEDAVKSSVQEEQKIMIKKEPTQKRCLLYKNKFQHQNDSAEFIYDFSGSIDHIKNIKLKELQFLYNDVNLDDNSNKFLLNNTLIELNSGKYKNIYTLIDEINNALSRASISDNIIVNINPINSKVCFKLKNEKINKSHHISPILAKQVSNLSLESTTNNKETLQDSLKIEFISNLNEILGFNDIKILEGKTFYLATNNHKLEIKNDIIINMSIIGTYLDEEKEFKLINDYDKNLANHNFMEYIKITSENDNTSECDLFIVDLPNTDYLIEKLKFSITYKNSGNPMKLTEFFVDLTCEF